jgi:hypothetical protein
MANATRAKVDQHFGTQPKAPQVSLGDLSELVGGGVRA